MELEKEELMNILKVLEHYHKGVKVLTEETLDEIQRMIKSVESTPQKAKKLSPNGGATTTDGGTNQQDK